MRCHSQSLFKAFQEAKKYVELDYLFDGHLKSSLPFLPQIVEETKEVFGTNDPWAYGVQANKHTIETLVQYSHEHGLIKRRYTLEELFAPEAFDTSKN